MDIDIKVKNKIKAYGICLYKKDQDTIKILLCKSVSSKNRWGFLKGIWELNETQEETAIREFKEESNIQITQNNFEQFFEQINKKKDIGIYLVNFYQVQNISNYFVFDQLRQNNLSRENTEVKFFDINKIPDIKKKQAVMIVNIIEYLKSKL